MSRVGHVRGLIGRVEGLVVEFRDRSGRVLGVDEELGFGWPYVQRAPEDWTVAQWRRQRFRPLTRTLKTRVLDAQGRPIPKDATLAQARLAVPTGRDGHRGPVWQSAGGRARAWRDPDRTADAFWSALAPSSLPPVAAPIPARVASVALDPAELHELTVSQQIARFLSDRADASAHTVQVAGRERLAGRECDIVIARTALGAEYHFWVDRSCLCLVRVAQARGGIVSHIASFAHPQDFDLGGVWPLAQEG